MGAEGPVPIHCVSLDEGVPMDLGKAPDKAQIALNVVRPLILHCFGVFGKKLAESILNIAQTGKSRLGRCLRWIAPEKSFLYFRTQLSKTRLAFQPYPYRKPCRPNLDVRWNVLSPL